MCACIKPCKTSRQGSDFQLSAIQEFLVHRCYLKFPACGRTDILCNFHHVIWIEIKSDDSIIALRLCRFLLDAEAIAVLVKLRDAIALRVTYLIPEDAGHRLLFHHFHSIAKKSGKAGTIEDIVAEDHAYVIISDELLTDDEGLGKTVR